MKIALYFEPFSQFRSLNMINSIFFYFFLLKLPRVKGTLGSRCIKKYIFLGNFPVRYFYKFLLYQLWTYEDIIRLEHGVLSAGVKKRVIDNFELRNFFFANFIVVGKVDYTQLTSSSKTLLLFVKLRQRSQIEEIILMFGFFSIAS